MKRVAALGGSVAFHHSHQIVDGHGPTIRLTVLVGHSNHAGASTPRQMRAHPHRSEIRANSSVRASQSR